MPLVRVLREYGNLYCGLEDCDLADDELPRASFELLQDLATSDELIGKTFTAGRVKGRGFSVRATSFVGIIQLPDNTQIEILPKLELGESDEDARRILLKMLASAYSLPFDPQRSAEIAQEKVSLLEYFIPPFLSEVECLIRRGIRGQYERVQENEQFLRGKLLLTEQIRLNTVNKCNFYCEYDIFSQNRAENRLLHSVLAMLYRRSRSEQNKKNCYRLLQEFLHIPESVNVLSDLESWDKSHENRYYQPLFSWCNMLVGLNPTLKSGNLNSFSLLFPMEKIFESYVTFKLQRKLAQQQKLKLLSQYQQRFGSWLKDKDDINSDGAFLLKPDLLLQINGATQLVLDAKWKKVELVGRGYNISESDLYQVFAYLNHFKPVSKIAILIYPLVGGFTKSIGLKFTNSHLVDYYVYAVPFDLNNDTICIEPMHADKENVESLSWI